MKKIKKFHLFDNLTHTFLYQRTSKFSILRSTSDRLCTQLSIQIFLGYVSPACFFAMLNECVGNKTAHNPYKHNWLGTFFSNTYKSHFIYTHNYVLLTKIQCIVSMLITYEMGLKSKKKLLLIYCCE